MPFSALAGGDVDDGDGDGGGGGGGSGKEEEAEEEGCCGCDDAPLVVVAGRGDNVSRANTSTIHSYQTFRLSVWRYMVTTISELAGTVRGVCGGFPVF